MRDRPEQGQGDQGELGVVSVSREGVQPHKKIPQLLPTTALVGCITSSYKSVFSSPSSGEQKMCDRVGSMFSCVEAYSFKVKIELI